MSIQGFQTLRVYKNSLVGLLVQMPPGYLFAAGNYMKDTNGNVVQS